MTKQQFVNEVLKSSGCELVKKDVEKVVESVFRVAGDTVRAEGRFSWPGFGTFGRKERSARRGRNPRTGQGMDIAASVTVGFKAAPSLRKSM